MSKKKIIIIGIPVFLILLFAVFPLVFQNNLSVNDPEENAKLEAEWEQDRITNEQKPIEQNEQEQQELENEKSEVIQNSFSDVRILLDEYLSGVKEATSECNKLSDDKAISTFDP